MNRHCFFLHWRGQHWSWLSVCKVTVCQVVRATAFTSCAQREPTDARSRPLWRAGAWLWPRRTAHSWCWLGRPGTRWACSCGPPCCCRRCCCGASDPWAWSGSWSGSLRDLKSFFPGWTRQRRWKRRGRWRDTPRTAGEEPSRPRGRNRARSRRSGHRAPAGRRTAAGSRTARGAGTGCRSACTGPPAAAGSSGTPACRVFCDQHRSERRVEMRVHMWWCIKTTTFKPPQQ